MTMKLENGLLVLAALWALGGALGGVPAASAQYLYLDVDGDGKCTSYDVLDATVRSVDVWIDTDHDALGNPSPCPTGEKSNIYSYSFILRWSRLGSNGSLGYGAWTDNMGFPVEAGGRAGGNDMWLARASATPLPPGKYKLGTLDVTVTGAVSLTLLARDDALDPTSLTSFGSVCPGKDFDDTIKLGSDFIDACSTSTSSAVARTDWSRTKATYR